MRQAKFIAFSILVLGAGILVGFALALAVLKGAGLV
jgi:hypothetical protein